MILLVQNSEIYNNDLRAMIMAFYPGIKIVTEKPDGEVLFTFSAEYGELCRFGIDNNTVTVDGDYKDKESFRNKLKLAVYRLLSEHTKRTLPWGDLTGVRPTKIAMARLVEGRSEDETVQYYREVYDVTEKKARLATEVAVNERRLLRTVDMENDYCLYVGIPFCPTRCLYCSFTSYPIEKYEEKAKSYIEQLKKELEYIAKLYSKRRLISVYVGGGTPTSISAGLLCELLTKIRECFDMSQVMEFTVEAGRPDSITDEKLEVMKKNEVTRISINPQTMNDETLRVIGRAHTKAQTREAFERARAHGFDNINMDIIAGLPGEDIDSMRRTLEGIAGLAPESVTVHSLAIKRAANLRQQLDDFGERIHHDMNEMLDLVDDVARGWGMTPYYMYRQKNIGGNLENVAYSLPGHECLYNILIMEEMTDIVAAGAGGSTKLVFHGENRVERVENCKSVDDYIERHEEMLERKKRAIDKG